MNSQTLNMAISDESEAKSAEQALTDKNWREAMRQEYESLLKNGTWELVPAPRSRNVISGPA